MKKQFLYCFYLMLLLAASPFFSAETYAQEQVTTHLIKYQFAVQDVSDLASAKEMTDYIRPLFNTTEKPFEFFPAYNSITKQFDFQSSINVSEADLTAVLQHHGLVLVSFSSVSIAAANPSEK